MAERLPQIAVAQLGSRRDYDVPVVLEQAGLLAHFFTDAYAGPGSWLGSVLTGFTPLLRWRGLKRLTERTAAIPSAKVTAFNRLLLPLLRAQYSSIPEQIGQHLRIADSFQRAVQRHGLEGAEALYCFDTAAAELFDYGRSQGLFCILEQCCPTRRSEIALLEENHRLWPGWEETPYHAGDLAPIIAREDREFVGADLILAPSQFVADSLKAAGVPPGKIAILPYGHDARNPGNRAFLKGEAEAGNEGLKILFVGGVGLRKGVPYLLQALQKLSPLPLRARFVGGLTIKKGYLQPYTGVAEFCGQVSRTEVAHFYQWADVFVLPSIYEGSAGVIYEALAAGLPVITTPNAGSVVQDGVEGFIVPIRDSEALSQRIEQLARDRDLHRWMSQNALKRARDFSRARYGQRLVAAITSAYGATGW